MIFLNTISEDLRNHLPLFGPKSAAASYTDFNKLTLL